MATKRWPTRLRTVAALRLDAKNPRLGAETRGRAPRELIQYLFDHDKAFEVAKSIATRGYFPNEPLLAVREDGRLVVVEGNRRLAALKALREPSLLAGAYQRKVERLKRQVTDAEELKSVPVTEAPSRRATDRQVAGRHIGTPVLAWQAENRASFILEKLEEGYTNDELRDELGFTLAHIQTARQTRAVADMARAMELDAEVRAKLDNPRAKVFTTLQRVLDSTAGRKRLMVAPDPDHGLRGTTTRVQFVKGFGRLVADVALGRESSRTLNTNDDIAKYFDRRVPREYRVEPKRGSFVPDDVVKGKLQGSPKKTASKKKTPQQKKINPTVIPRDFKVRYGNDRLVDIRRELGKLKRDDFPNAGAVLLRVFVELSIRHYLDRTGQLARIEARLKKKGRLPFGSLQMKQLASEATRVAKTSLGAADATAVAKALKYDKEAPFSISDLHGFVHHTDFPSSRDILQFWVRIEPLLRFMLEEDGPTS